MTVYKAIAVYLKSKEGTTALNCIFYPSEAPQNPRQKPLCIFSTRDNIPEPTHAGGFTHGNIIIQFDFFADSLTDLDGAVDRFKQHFVGQSITLDSTVKQAFATTDNEFDGFDEKSKLYIRSVDLNIKYILT